MLLAKISHVIYISQSQLLLAKTNEDPTSPKASYRTNLSNLQFDRFTDQSNRGAIRLSLIKSFPPKYMFGSVQICMAQYGSIASRYIF